MFLSDCIVYLPHSIDIPLIEEKGDLRIDAGVSLLPTAEATFSFGLTDRIAGQGYGSLGSDNRYYIQAGAGNFRPLGKLSVKDTYGGLAMATVMHKGMQIRGTCTAITRFIFC